ncbi:MAG TPA: FadR/GntR family transcriptional regulator [Chloroflexia bacterium]|nr:FadR/GntR family transcriptional regulator [Chloroflexia bacterium]
MNKRADVLSVKVAQALVRRITSKEFSPGSVLPSERELQEEYQVSRTVVREALKMLSARGFISTSAGQGAVVGSDLTGVAMDSLLLAFHQADVRAEDILATRALLEPQVAALAAQNATVPQIRRLKSLIQKLEDIDFEGDENAKIKGSQLWSEYDTQFHELLAEASQNPVLAILTKVIVGILWRQEAQTEQEGPLILTLENRTIALEQHRALAVAVEERDPEKARLTMTGHLEHTKKNFTGLHNNLAEILGTLAGSF